MELLFLSLLLFRFGFRRPVVIRNTLFYRLWNLRKIRLQVRYAATPRPHRKERHESAVSIRWLDLQRQSSCTGALLSRPLLSFAFPSLLDLAVDQQGGERGGTHQLQSARGEHPRGRRASRRGAAGGRMRRWYAAVL